MYSPSFQLPHRALSLSRLGGPRLPERKGVLLPSSSAGIVQRQKTDAESVRANAPPVYNPFPRAGTGGIQLRAENGRIAAAQGNPPVYRPQTSARSPQSSPSIQRLTIPGGPNANYDSAEAAKSKAERTNDGNVPKGGKGPQEKKHNLAIAQMNYATVCFSIDGEMDYITERNAGMQSTHAEVLCWRKLVDVAERKRVNENGKVSIHENIAKLQEKTGLTILINWIYSEREPCQDCERLLDERFRRNDVPVYYSVKFRDVAKDVVNDEIFCLISS